MKLVYFYYLPFEAFCDLLCGKGSYFFCLQVGDALRGFEYKRYFSLLRMLAFYGLAAEDARVGNHVLLKRINMPVAALVDGVEVNDAVHSPQPELLYLAVAHVEQIEHLQLVGI